MIRILQNMKSSLLAFLTMSACTMALNSSQQDVQVIPLTKHKTAVTRFGELVSWKTSYYGTMHVGNPAQSFSVIFDTGSGHLVLPSLDCESSTCKAHKQYDYEKSVGNVMVNIDKSEVVPGQPFDEVTVNYGTGHVEGSFTMDNVCFGSTSGKKGICTRMGFLEATEMAEDPFASFPADGILGLGLGPLALNSEFNFFTMLVQSGNLPHVGMFIGGEDEDLELSVGGHNPARLASPLEWAPVTNSHLGYWQVKVSAIHIGDHKLDICNDGGCTAILDTGTSHIGVPAEVEDLIEDLLSKPAEIQDDCKASKGFQVSFELQGFNLTIGPDNYMRSLPLSLDVHGGPADHNALENNSIETQAWDQESFQSNLVSNFRGSNKEAEHWCRPLLMPVTLPEQFGPKVFILGEPLLTRYYTVFDGGGPAVGFGLGAVRARNQVEDALIFMQQSVHKSSNDDEFVMVQMVVVVKKVQKKVTKIDAIEARNIGLRMLA